MIKLDSKIVNQDFVMKRIIDKIVGNTPGPCLIFICGIHGNEQASIFALLNVFEELRKKKTPIKGTLIALAGNLSALKKKVRFCQADLNRIWIPSKMEQLTNGTFKPQNEDEEQQKEIFKNIHSIFSTEKGPFYFFDLHTTSSKSTPFLTVNDSLLNRKFTQKYPSPILLGIEEYLEGTLLSYINELGYVSFGFESGPHEDIKSIKDHIAFIYLSLVFSGAIDKKNIHFNTYFKVLSRVPKHIYEIYHQHKIKENEKFIMEPGFINFQKIRKGELLAWSDGVPIFAKKPSYILMPLYQLQGDDGYFLIRKIPHIFLYLSKILRKWKVYKILHIMPGIHWASKKRDSLIVNKKIVKLFTKHILHLLGYRSKEINKTHIITKSRELASKDKDYKKETWYK